MKTLFSPSYLFLVLALGMLACQEEENRSGTGEIQFAINDLLQNASGRTAALPDGASILISIEDASGNVVFTRKKVNLLSFDGQYSSAPVKLDNGSYKLTDFMIVDESNAVVYATPRAGSRFAILVSRPLPVSFTISTGQSTSVPTQVVRATEAEPEDFGYATFPISIAVFPEFAVSVFGFKAGELKLTPAQAYLLHDDDTIYRKSLGPQVSDIVFKGEQDGMYTLVVVKPGFAKYRRTFVLSQLREELDNEPLEIILQPAVTMTIIPEHETVQFSFFMSGISGKEVAIDWGDGYIEYQTLHSFNPDDFNVYEYTHTYQDPTIRPYFVSIAGDMDAIQELGFGWTGGLLDFAVQNAVNLASFRLSFNYGIESVDMSAHHKLETLAIGFAYDVKSINIGDNRISYLALEELPSLSASELNKVVGDLYARVAMDVYPGTLQLYNLNGDFMDLLTPESIQKLRTLEDYGGWSIEPDFPE